MMRAAGLPARVVTGEDGLAVVKILQAASESLRRSGETVALS